VRRFVALLFLSCSGDPLPQLITVRDLLPREAEIGDKLAISGDGFPQGREARVRFRGALHRPGQFSERAEIEASGIATSPNSVEVAFDEDLEARFCGAGKRAAHTTFSGEIEVAFSPAIEGAPPVAGSSAGVVLDVRPPIAPRAQENAREDGLRTLAALGIHVDEKHALLVSAVDRGSRAESAGLLAGDVLASWDGVRASSLADVALAPGEPWVKVALRRGGSPAEQSREISAAGIAAKGSIDALACLLIIAIALGCAMAIGAPRPQWLARLESRLLSQRIPFAEIAWAAVFALFLWIAIALARIDLDVLPIALASFASLVGTAFVTRSPVWAATKQLAPFLLATGATALNTGVLRLGDAVRAQGTLPWEWQIARDPMGIALFALALAPLAASTEHATLRMVARSVTGVCASVLVMIFLGGWSAPWSGAAGVAVGFTMYAAKVIGVITLVLWVARARLPMPRVVLISAACAAASVVFSELAPPAAARYFAGALVLCVPPAIATAFRILRRRPRWIPSTVE